MSDDIEVRAKEMGWVPQDKWTGPPEKWTEAAAFVEHGETVLPIIRSQYQKSLGELTTVRSELAAEKAARAEIEGSVEELKKFHQEFTANRVKEAREKIIRELAEARRENDTEAEVRLTTDLEELRTTAAQAATEATTKKEPVVERKTELTIDPTTQQWMNENPKFRDDLEWQALSFGVAAKMRQEGNKDTGRAFLDAVAARTEERFGNSGVRRDIVDRTLGSRNSGTNGGGSSSDYNSLPSEAKAQCDKEGAKFIGSKAYPDEASWRKYYVGLYNS